MTENLISNFTSYFDLGWNHIMIWGALDHHLYLLSSVLLFDFKDLKKILLLITAFTLGHFLSMFLGAFNLISVSTKWVEVLIAFSIFASTLYNLTVYTGLSSKRKWAYLLPLIFGFVHGLGFSVVLNMILSNEEHYFLSFFGFNLGVEIAQIIVVIALLALSHFLRETLKLPMKYWVYLCCTPLLLISMKMMFERI